MKFFFERVIMDYGEIIRRAWNITKKYKYLWIFAFILALFGGRGGYNGSNLSNSFQYTFRRGEIALPVVLQQFLFKLQNFLINNTGLIILFAIFMIILAIAGFTLYIIADGGLIGSVKNIEAGEKNSLKDGFKTGSNYFWRMLGKNLLTGLIGVFIALIFLLIFSTIYFLTPISQNKQYLPENVGIILFFISFYFVILLFNNSEHLCSTRWACSFYCWSSIFHSYSLFITHFFFFSALYTISLHFLPPFANKNY